MQNSRDRRATLKPILVAFMIFSFITLLSEKADAEWKYGIGTGPQFLNIEGDVGFDTALGPVQANVDLDPDDIWDLTETALGFLGYATDDNWKVLYGLGYLELEESGARGTRTGGVFNSKINFEVTKGELLVGYPIWRNDSCTVRGYGGLRYIKHEYEFVLTGTGFTSVNRNRNFDESWIDGLLAVSADIPFAKTWNWSLLGNAGYGESEGTYQLFTSLNWRFYKGWSTTLFGSFTDVEYENASRGASDWYLYDAEESALGLAILYNW